MDIVKSLEKICREVCKELPEENYHVGFLYTFCFQGPTPILPSGNMPIGIGIYTVKGFLFKKIDEFHAKIQLRGLKGGLMGIWPEGELGDEKYLKKHDLKIYSPDEKILYLYNKKINESDELRSYLNEKGIKLKRFLQEF